MPGSLSFSVRAAIQDYGRKWLASFTRVADTKPRLALLPAEVVGLIFLLGFLCFEAGERIGNESKVHSPRPVILGALVVNWIASQFCWSQRTTIILQVVAFASLIAAVVLWT